MAIISRVFKSTVAVYFRHVTSDGKNTIYFCRPLYMESSGAYIAIEFIVCLSIYYFSTIIIILATYHILISLSQNILVNLLSLPTIYHVYCFHFLVSPLNKPKFNKIKWYKTNFNLKKPFKTCTTWFKFFSGLFHVTH